MTIIKQGNTYHAELNVPKDVQYVLGRRRFRKTLNTTDIKEAQRKGTFRCFCLERKDSQKQRGRYT